MIATIKKLSEAVMMMKSASKEVAGVVVVSAATFGEAVEALEAALLEVTDPRYSAPTVPFVSVQEQVGSSSTAAWSRSQKRRAALQSNRSTNQGMNHADRPEDRSRCARLR